MLRSIQKSHLVPKESTIAFSQEWELAERPGLTAGFFAGNMEEPRNKAYANMGIPSLTVQSSRENKVYLKKENLLCLFFMALFPCTLSFFSMNYDTAILIESFDYDSTTYYPYI